MSEFHCPTLVMTTASGIRLIRDDRSGSEWNRIHAPAHFRAKASFRETPELLKIYSVFLWCQINPQSPTHSAVP